MRVGIRSWFAVSDFKFQIRVHGWFSPQFYPDQVRIIGRGLPGLLGTAATTVVHGFEP